jgi:hypothetical protein
MTSQAERKRFIHLATGVLLGAALLFGMMQVMVAASPTAPEDEETRATTGRETLPQALLAPTAVSCWATIDGTTVYSSTDASALQDAVDAAGEWDTVKVAGTCAGVHSWSDSNYVYTQTLHITKSNFTIQGGYTYTNWLADPDPAAYPTVLDAQGEGRVVSAPSTDVQNVTLDGLIFTNGDSRNNLAGRCGRDSLSGGGGICLYWVSNFVIQNSTIYNNTAQDGGGINHHGGGSVILVNTAVVSNTSTTVGGGIYNRYNPLELYGSTVSGNYAGTGGGGVYVSLHNLTMFDSTISGNETGGNGGGIYAFGHGAAEWGTIVGSSIVSNTASTDGGGIYQVNATLEITNTLVAYNSDGDSSSPDCYGELTSGDYNLIQDTTGCTLTGTLTHVITGTDPLLEPLADNGGETETHALLQGSPAVDWIPAGTNGCGMTLIEDQRGVVRPQGSACDVGAYEMKYPCFAEITGDSVTDFASTDASAVQAAIDALAPTSYTVNLAGTCAGVQMRGGISQTAYISRSVTLQGGYTHTNWLAAPNPDTYPTTLDAQNAGRVVYIPNGTYLSWPKIPSA